MAAEPKNKPNETPNTQTQDQPVPPVPPAVPPSSLTGAAAPAVVAYVVAEGQCVSGLLGGTVEGEMRTAHAGQLISAEDLDPAAYKTPEARTSRLDRLVTLGVVMKAGSLPVVVSPVVATAVTSQDEVQ